MALIKNAVKELLHPKKIDPLRCNWVRDHHDPAPFEDAWTKANS
jgi:hypothetical protein